MIYRYQTSLSRFTLSYAELLCNTAEAQEMIGSRDAAAESLSSALKTVETVKNMASMTDPTLARILGIIYHCWR